MQLVANRCLRRSARASVAAHGAGNVLGGWKRSRMPHPETLSLSPCSAEVVGDAYLDSRVRLNRRQLNGTRPLITGLPALFNADVGRRHRHVEHTVAKLEVAGTSRLQIGGAVAMVRYCLIRKPKGELGSNEVLAGLSGYATRF